MIFKCNNCGGTMAYSPERSAMYCEHCESINSESVTPGSGVTSCYNCGAPMEISEYDSATTCIHCGVACVFDERVTGEYTPHKILPFQLGKNTVKEKLRDHFKRSLFLPSDFLSNASLDRMHGEYVPFWMYDYDAKYFYEANATKVRRWTVGNTEYTETSYYKIVRDMSIDYDMIPADASIKMVDGIMDLMEPYNYSALQDFQAKYMAGFEGEMYNYKSDEIEYRAKDKAAKFSDELVQRTLVGYSSVRPIRKDLKLTPVKTTYSLLPVWQYTYSYKGKNYDFSINGQTGKIVGNPPISEAKRWGYTAVCFVLMNIAVFLGWAILEVL